MRVLLTSNPHFGHFHPLVPIARAMTDAGHEVAFATPVTFVPAVERAGFRALPAGPAKDVAEAFPELRSLRGRDVAAFMWAQVRPAQAAAMASDLLGIIARWRPDLLVADAETGVLCLDSAWPTNAGPSSASIRMARGSSGWATSRGGPGRAGTATWPRSASAGAPRCSTPPAGPRPASPPSRNLPAARRDLLTALLLCITGPTCHLRIRLPTRAATRHARAAW